MAGSHADPNKASQDTCPTHNGVYMAGIVNHARRRPSQVPRAESQSFPAYKAKQDIAFRIGISGLEEELAKATGVSRVEILEDGQLTVGFRSQSKLSQQELVDLQKATHFDKKELQQWYKGV